MGASTAASSGTQRESQLQRWALNIGAVLGSVCLLMTLAAVLFGLKPLVFISGSMGPEIPTGSLGLAIPQPVEDLVVGDIVSVVASDEVRVTHRVVEKTEAGLILKGDANPVADLQPYAVDEADKLLFSVPGLGYVVSWLSQPWMYFAGGLLCAYLLYIAFARQGHGRKNDVDGNNEDPGGKAEPDPGKDATPQITHRARGRSGSQLLAAVTVLSLAVASIQLFPLAETTRAAFSTTAQASASVQADVMQPARAIQCTNRSASSNNKIVDFTWTAPIAQSAPLAGYKISVQVKDSAESFSDLLPVSTTSYAVDISRSNGLLYLLIDLLGNLLGSSFDVNFRVYAVYQNGWTAVPALYPAAKGTIAVLGLDRSLRCA